MKGVIISAYHIFSGVGILAMENEKAAD